MGALLLMFLVACGSSNTDNAVEVEESDNFNKTGMPIVDEEITLDFFLGKTAATADDWNDVMIFNEYRDMTNINVEWEMIPYEGLEEKRNLAISSGSLPDAFHSANIPVRDIARYGEQGIFMPLNDLIDEYAPNLKQIFEENPEIEKAMTYPDGNIYALPTMDDPEFTAIQVSAAPWFRADWLEELGRDVPETTEEFYEFLKDVKETDLMGDGSGEEVPFGAQNINSLFNWLKGSFGVGNRGLTVGLVDEDPEEEGKVRFYPIAEGYKEMLQYANTLFEEGLIEQNIFSIEHDQYFANAAEGRYASTYVHSPADLFGGEASDNYTGGKALEGPNGDKLYAGLRHPVVIPGSFVITKENENLPETMRWIDYFYGDEGQELFMMGIEGETFEITEDGEYEYVEDIRDNPDGLNLDQSVSRYLTWPGGMYPGITKKKFFKGAEASDISQETVEKLEPNLIDEVWPAFTYTEEENKKMTSFGADIEKYVGEARDKFVNGDMSFDEWDNYVKTIEDMNLEEYMEIQQEAYERYESN